MTELILNARSRFYRTGALLWEKEQVWLVSAAILVALLILNPAQGAESAAFVGRCEQVTRLLADTLQRHGGSISAEHGIGLVKKDYLRSTRSAAEIEVMRGIQRVLDPHGIMNPGKLFDP